MPTHLTLQFASNHQLNRIQQEPGIESIRRRKMNSVACQRSCWLRLGMSVVIACLGMIRNQARADEPILRVNSTGATSFVTTMAFAPDGRTLYSAGFDKVVRVWQWDAEAEQFRLQPETTYRIPIGPGEAGSINTIAVSHDGRWLIIGGSALMSGANDFRKPGGVFPTRGALTPEMRLDQGRLFVFDTLTRERRVIRAHNGSVLTASFLPGSSRYFVSAADEWDPNADDGKGDRIGRVRLFDLETGDEIANAAMPAINSRPGIAPINIGEDPRSARIGLAWGDGKLRIWDVAGNRTLTVADGTQSNNAIDYAIEEKKLLTGTFEIEQRTAQGEINLWTVRERDGQPNRIGESTVLMTQGESYPFPRALSLLPLGERNFVAVVSRMTTPPSTINGWRVELLELQSDALETQNRFSLSQIPAGTRMPALASSSDGQWFAIGGSGDQTIRVYKTAEVVRGDNEPYQSLTGQGRVIRSARFVERDDRRGLELLSANDQERWLFDLDSRTLTPGRVGGWSLDRPSATGFDLQVSASRDTGALRSTLTITGPGLDGRGRSETRIDLPEDHEFITSAVLPNVRGRFLPVEIPIIAIASHRFGLPRLALYNLATGETIRELSGHSERLLSLSFSGDGRFLVSTANDQTVCVWSLVDLDLSVGIRGGINGLALDNREGRVEVVQVDPTAKIRNQLQVGDRIDALVIDGQTIDIENARRFYSTMWKTAPGTPVVVKKPTGDVEITVEQGIDERKPLFFLYIEASDEEGGDVAGYEWVAWSPLGPFDSTGDSIERHLGWHFNGNNEDEPVRFALLDEYPELRRPGILGEMLDVGRLPDVAVQPLDRPTMRLRIPGFRPAGPKLPLIVDRSPDEFELTILGLTPRQVQSVSLLVDDRRIGELTFAENQRWQISNTQESWTRGAHRLTARVLTNEIDPQTFEQVLEFSFFLPAPQIDLPSGRQDWTDEESYDVSAVILPNADETVVVRLQQVGNAEPRELKTWEVTQRETLTFPVRLTPGLNQFQFTAYNQNAADPDSREESRSVRLVVAYAPQRPKPPARVDLTLEPRADDPTTRPLRLHPGETLRLEEQSPRITVEASGSDELPDLELRVLPEGEGAEPQTFPLSFEEDEEKRRAKVAMELAEPGDYGIRVFDRTNDLELFEATVTRLAKLPEIQVLTPQDGDILLSGRDEPKVAFEAAYVGMLDDDSISLQALVNDRPFEIEIDPDNKTVFGELDLEPGNNTIVLRWSNSQRTRQSRPVTIAYRLPPRILSSEGEVGESPMATLRMEVASNSDLDRVSVNGAIWQADKVDLAENGNAWSVTIREVPVAEGNNRFELYVWNQEAKSLAPSAVRVEYVAPRRLEPADVVVLAPQSEVVTDQSRFEIEFEVSSTNQLLDADLYNGNVLVDRGQDLISIRPNAQGEYLYRRKLSVQLHAGPNQFRIVTINQAGRKETRVKTITYQEPPVRLTIEGITLPGDPSNLIQPELVGNGRIRFDEPVDSDVVIVHAVADWRGLSDEFRKERTPTIQVLVNEFLQISNGQVDGEVSRFELPILLSKSENSVRVVLPHYKGEASSQAEFRLKCNNPTPNKRLHLLIVGIGATEDQSREIEDRVLETLRAERQTERTFRTETFQNGRIYGPIVGSDLNQGDLLSGLINIQDTIRISKGQDNYLDVVMLYVEGGRMVARDGGFVVTTQPASFPISRRIARDPYSFANYSLPSTSLRAMVQSTDGAKILMLDMLEGSSEEDVAEVNFDPEARAAMLRFMWVEGQDEQRPFPAFLEAIAKKRNLNRLDQWRDEFLKLAESINALRYNETVSPSIANLIMVDSRRDE